MNALRALQARKYGFHENYYQKPELPHETKEYKQNNKEKVKIPVFNGLTTLK